jgi:hypothetical protein
VTEIAVVVPVLGRPGHAQPLADSLAAATTVSYRLVFVCSPLDVEQQLACLATGADVLVTDWVSGRGDFAMKINAAYRATSEPYLFQAADDVRFHPHWDVEALAAITAGGGYGVCGTNDDANPSVKAGLHSTHSLIARWYIDECGASADGPGSVFAEAYWHQWCDVELVELARLRGCFTFAARSVVAHAHPIWKTADDDATYRKGALHVRDDQRLFQQRRRAWEAVAA